MYICIWRKPNCFSLTPILFYVDLFFYCCTIFNSGNTMWAHPRDSNITSKPVTIILLYFFSICFKNLFVLQHVGYNHIMFLTPDLISYAFLLCVSPQWIISYKMNILGSLHVQKLQTQILRNCSLYICHKYYLHHFSCNPCPFPLNSGLLPNHSVTG